MRPIGFKEVAGFTAVLLLCVFSLSLSGYWWLHITGLRSTRVIESIEKTQTGERYTIPSEKRDVAISPADGLWAQTWTDAQVVIYERWKITSKDGFEVELSKVDPLNAPSIGEGTRYTAFWK